MRYAKIHCRTACQVYAVAFLRLARIIYFCNQIRRVADSHAIARFFKIAQNFEAVTFMQEKIAGNYEASVHLFYNSRFYSFMPLKKRINDIVGIVKISRRVVASVKSCFEALYIVRLKFVIAVENFPVNGAGLAYVLFSSVPPLYFKYAYACVRETLCGVNSA